MRSFLLRFQVDIRGAAVAPHRLIHEVGLGVAVPFSRHVAGILAGTHTNTSAHAETPDSDRSPESFFALRASK